MVYSFLLSLAVTSELKGAGGRGWVAETQLAPCIVHQMAQEVGDRQVGDSSLGKTGKWGFFL